MLMLSGYGYISGYLVPEQLYTLKYTRSLGFFYLDEFETYLKWYIQKSANLISIIKSGEFPEKIYITINPIVKNLTSDYIVKTIGEGIEKFRNKYTPIFAESNLSFVDILKGSGEEVKKKETEESKLPGWAKQLAIIAGVVVVGAVAIKSLIKKI